MFVAICPHSVQSPFLPCCTAWLWAAGSTPVVPYHSQTPAVRKLMAPCMGAIQLQDTDCMRTCRHAAPCSYVGYGMMTHPVPVSTEGDGVDCAGQHNAALVAVRCALPILHDLSSKMTQCSPPHAQLVESLQRYHIRHSFAVAFKKASMYIVGKVESFVHPIIMWTVCCEKLMCFPLRTGA